jgi:hypothetical protein
MVVTAELRVKNTREVLRYPPGVIPEVFHRMWRRIIVPHTTGETERICTGSASPLSLKLIIASHTA